MSKAVVFFADGTEECEAWLVVDVLRRAGVEVCVASAEGRLELVSSHGLHMTADALAEEVDYAAQDLLVVPGGLPGTYHLRDCKTVTDALLAQAAAGKYVAAICAAPSILGGLGLLQGRSAASHPGFEDKLTGATVCREEFVQDGNIITGRGLGAALPFALHLAALLAGQDASDTIRHAICYTH